MATNISVFLSYIATSIEGVPDPLIEQQTRHTLADFCERSLVLKTEKTANLVSGTATYNITPDTDTQVVKVLSVYVDGEPISQTSVEELDESVADWRTATGVIDGYLLTSHEDVQFVRIPDSSITAGIRYRYAYRPDIAAVTFNDMLYERWFEGIMAGIKARLFMISGKPWSDPAQAGYYRGIYEDAIGAAAAMGAKQFGSIALRVRACP